MIENKDKRSEEPKPLYEPPAVIDLGEIARGDGCCGQGSGNLSPDGECMAGWTAAFDHTGE